MVPSNADIIIQNRRISQSETSARTNGDVVNIYSLQHALVGGDQNVSLHQYFRLLLDYRENVNLSVFQVIVRLPRHLDISQQQLFKKAEANTY